MPDVFVAVISGRSVTNVKEMVGIEGITYAGNHGLEIIHPDGTRFTHPMPTEMEGKVGVLLEQLQQECCKVRSCNCILYVQNTNYKVSKKTGRYYL